QKSERKTSAALNNQSRPRPSTFGQRARAIPRKSAAMLTCAPDGRQASATHDRRDATERRQQPGRGSLRRS
ncbi:MAG: hypothetical protein ACR2G4_12600, partial [Pyrinomonadaceae bacterium]